MDTLWQIRHTIVHNVGVITQSDALKFRRVARIPIQAPQRLRPKEADLRHKKRFLDETAVKLNNRIATRMADLLTDILLGDPKLFDPQNMANDITKDFQFVITVSGKVGKL